jgi:hypothetical protein
MMVAVLVTVMLAPHPASATHWGDIGGSVSNTAWVDYFHQRCVPSNGIVKFRMISRSTNVTFSHAASATIGGTAYVVRSWDPGETHTTTMGVPKGTCFYWNSRKHSNCLGTCFYGSWTGWIFYDLDGVNSGQR